MTTETENKNENENLEQELEKAADEVFGSEEEITKQAAEATAEQPDPDSGEPAQDSSDTKAEDETGAGEPKTDEAKPAEKAEGEKAEGEKAEGEKAEGEETSAEKEEDPYEVPKDMKGRTRDRFEKLTTDLKQSHEQIEKQTEIIKGLRTVLESTGMNSKELQQTLELGGMIKTDPKRALDALRGVVEDLSGQLGEVPPGKDPLEDFADLRQKVEDREITQEDARELATFRLRVKAEQEQAERDRQAQTKQQEQSAAETEFTTRVISAQEGVAKFLKNAEKDPDFLKIAPTLVKAAEFSVQNLDPDKWLGYIEGEFEKVKEIAVALAPPPSTGDSPILGGGAPPGGQREPQTMEDLADILL